MATDSIDKSEWKQFFDDFSREHQGKPMTATLFGPGTGGGDEGGKEAKALPLNGIILEEKGSEAGSVRVLLGDRAGDHLDHVVVEPTRVWQRSSDDAGGEMLEIHGADDRTLILKNA